MPRLLVLCRRPYHMSPEEAGAWLRGELERVLRADQLPAATLTRLADSPTQAASDWGWLIELAIKRGHPAEPARAPSACRELLADLRLLGMAPAAAMSDERDAIELRRP